MTEATISSPPPISRVSIPAIAAWVFFAALWFGLWRQLSGEWSVNDQYSYGWFVPLFAIVLFWLRWEDAPKARELGAGSWELAEQKTEDRSQSANNQEQITSNGKARAIAIFIAIVALLLLFPIRLFEIGNPDWRPLDWLHALCVVAITLVFLWRIGGKARLRHFAFPVAFTLVAVPWVTPIEEPIVQGLMRIVATIASETAALFGIPTMVQGNLIRIPSGLLGVNEACSGVRSLQTSLMIGLLFGELKRLSIQNRVLLVAAAIAIAFIGNCIRAFFLVWVAATQNTSVANRWHDLAGYGIVAAVFVGSLTLAALLGRGHKSEVRDHRSENPYSSFVIRHSSFLATAVLFWLVGVEIAAASWYRMHERNFAQTARWDVQWPQGAPNFHEIKMDTDLRRALRFDSGQAASWTLPNSDSPALARKPPNCTGYFFRWNSGKNSALLANLHRPDVCLPAIGWKQTSDTGVKIYPVAPNLSLAFRHFSFLHGAPEQPAQQTAHAFYCLWEDRVSRSGTQDSSLPEMATSRSAWTRAERVRVVLEGRRHLGQQVLELVIAGRGELDAEEAETMFAALVPQVIRKVTSDE